MLCLTFDTDHCDEGRMREWLAACTFPGRGTIFCTQVYACLASHEVEIGPHPVVQAGANPAVEIQHWRNLFPESTCWRPHSLATSQLMSVKVGRAGYRITSTMEMFACEGIRPVRSPWGCWEMPIFYMDNSDFSREDYGTVGDLEVFDPRIIEAAVSGTSLYVFDFHPIHYLLNTPSYAHYLEHAPAFKAGADIAQVRFAGYGTASFFNDLVGAMTKSGARSLTLSEALDRWCAAVGVEREGARLHQRPRIGSGAA